VTEFGNLILTNIDFLHFYFPVFSLGLVSIEKICQTLKIVFDHISKHFELFVKNTPLRVVFSTLSRCLEMWSNTAFRVSYITSEQDMANSLT